jgi:hypothetical protein
LIAERINRASVNGQNEVRLALLELREALQREAPCQIASFCLWKEKEPDYAKRL